MPVWTYTSIDCCETLEHHHTLLVLICLRSNKRAAGLLCVSAFCRKKQFEFFFKI